MEADTQKTISVRTEEYMIGAIIGDIVGSRFEWYNIKSKNFNLYTAGCFFTDDYLNEDFLQIVNHFHNNF